MARTSISVLSIVVARTHALVLSYNLARTFVLVLSQRLARTSGVVLSLRLARSSTMELSAVLGSLPLFGTLHLFWLFGCLWRGWDDVGVAEVGNVRIRSMMR